MEKQGKSELPVENEKMLVTWDRANRDEKSPRGIH